MRKKPYTQIGIRRLKCFRCGEKAEFQWQICSDSNQYRPICKACDIELNRTVLEFMRFKNVDALMHEYEKKING